jgi:hypothetical protein
MGWGKGYGTRDSIPALKRPPTPGIAEKASEAEIEIDTLPAEKAPVQKDGFISLIGRPS